MLNRRRHQAAFTVAAQEPTGGIDDLRGHNHCLVVTCRKDGTAVPTPVWFGVAGGKVYVHSAPEDGKIKRMRRNPEVLAAACDMCGKPLSPAFRGTARFLPPEEEAAAERAIQDNHGVQRRVFMTVARGMPDLYVEITPI